MEKFKYRTQYLHGKKPQGKLQLKDERKWRTGMIALTCTANKNNGALVHTDTQTVHNIEWYTGIHE